MRFIRVMQKVTHSESATAGTMARARQTRAAASGVVPRQAWGSRFMPLARGPAEEASRPEEKERDEEHRDGGRRVGLTDEGAGEVLHEAHDEAAQQGPEGSPQAPHHADDEGGDGVGEGGGRGEGD